jgi:hypothetical protein
MILNVEEQPEFLDLTRELCRFASGVVADGNDALFRRLIAELPFKILRFRSGNAEGKRLGWPYQIILAEQGLSSHIWRAAARHA